MLESKTRNIEKIYICDDDRSQGDKLASIVASIDNNIKDISIFSSSKELLDNLKKLNNIDFPQVVFLDIEMPELDGITLGKSIKKMNREVFIIFVTAYVEYVLKGYEAEAFRYLLKPIEKSDITHILSDIKKIYNNHKLLKVKSHKGEVLLPISEIIYISAEDKYTVIYTKDNHYVTDDTLAWYEEQLDKYGFYRIYRKYVVNLLHHKAIKKNKLVITGNVELPISKKKIEDYKNTLFEYMGDEVL